MAAGSKEDPWKLTTPPGSSDYTIYRDEAADPPSIVCQVGSTRGYSSKAIGCRSAPPTRTSLPPKAPLRPGARRRQSGGRLVRPAQGISRPLRHVHAAAPGSTWTRGTHPRKAEQQHAGRRAEVGSGLHPLLSNCRSERPERQLLSNRWPRPELAKAESRWGAVDGLDPRAPDHRKSRRREEAREDRRRGDRHVVEGHSDRLDADNDPLPAHADLQRRGSFQRCRTGVGR